MTPGGVRPIWIGGDPGQDLGLVARDGDQLVAHRLVTRAVSEWPGHGIGPAFLSHAVAQLHDFRAEVALANPGRIIRVGIEGVNVPGGFADGRRAFVHPRDLIAVSLVAGALIAAFPQAVVVAPGGNGGGALRSYPAALVSDAERRLGLNRPAGTSSPLRHLRSAWDVSLTAGRSGRTQFAAVAR